MEGRIGKVQVIDSHTGGEPTRVVTGGMPDLGDGPISVRAKTLVDDFDWFRSAVVNEPRGSDILIGAALLEPFDERADVGVIFFNNVGLLGMCGHGTIGVMETLRVLGKELPSQIVMETPVGLVEAGFREDGWVWVKNVPSFRYAQGVDLEVPGYGKVTGDVAYGGNWFFLCDDHGQELGLNRVEELTAFSWLIREQLPVQKVFGADFAEIDHIELMGPAFGQSDSRNFVLCPGKAYDRSPCGTGTSAKLACLAADGKLAPGEVWRQESVTGSVFEGTYEELGDGRILPTVAGQAWVTAESTLFFDDTDPLKHGIGSNL